MTFPHRQGPADDTDQSAEPPHLPSSIDSLKLNVSTALVPHNLEWVKDKLLSILQAFDNEAVEQEWILASLSHIVKTSMQILMLFETIGSIQSDDIHKFYMCLEDIGTFPDVMSRWKTYGDVNLPKFVDFKRSTLEQRLDDISITLQSPLSIVQMNKSFENFNSGHRGDNVSTEMFGNAQRFTLKGSNIYSANGSIYLMEARTPFSENRTCIIDVELETELHIGNGYRFHRGKVDGKVVAVKVFEGSNAKKLLLNTVELNRGIMHPNVLTVYRKPNNDPFDQFLLFRADCRGTVATELPQALMDGIQKTWFIAANTIVGCARALLYLENSRLPLAHMRPEHFVPMVSTEGKVVISLDADQSLNLCEAKDGTAGTSTVMQICSGLIQKTFYASCQTFYPIERVYEDEGAQEADAENEDEDEKHLRSSESVLPQPFPITRTSPSKSKGHRWELVWKSPNAIPWSLEQVAQVYEASLRHAHAENLLIHRQGRPRRRIAHRCRGYKRTEIVLTPHIDQSEIISHASPVPNEICGVCGETVSEEEIFDCSCGSLDNDPARHTIKCSGCRRWQHQDCAKILSDILTKNYTCWRCDLASKPSEVVQTRARRNSESELEQTSWDRVLRDVERMCLHSYP